MSYLRLIGLLLVGLFVSLPANALLMDNSQRAVWANEAIVATFTYDHNNFLDRQKDIAHYFTADGWIRYSQALKEAHLAETVKSHFYTVNAVATQPPDITALGSGKWQAVMPVLVVYKNPEYTQQQTLKITVTFIEAPSGTGVRGFAMTDLVAVVDKAPCQCATKDSFKQSMAWA
jgi:hypothetical protein